jgi:mannosylglycoprotein endo-beta-mannosidase
MTSAPLDGAWWARRADDDADDGAELSAPGALHEHPPGAAWLPTRVPCTALSVLVDNGLLPDPFIGANAAHVPDVFHAGRAFYTFWYATRWRTPLLPAGAPCEAARAALRFEGANYRIAVWLNGMQLPLDGADDGMYLPKRADATAALLPPSGTGLANTLCVRVEPPDHVGCVDGGGQGGDHALARDVCMQCTQGWDWAAPVADRNTGLWGGVTLERTGPVALRDVHVLTDVTPGGGADADAGAVAEVTLRATLCNAGADAQAVTLTAQLHAPGGFALPCAARVVVAVTLAPGETREVLVAERMHIHAPQLWWPRGLGAQPLYEAHVAACVPGWPGASDTRHTRFGLRSLAVPLDAATGGRVFVVNGTRVFVRGANYITSDLRLRTARRTSTEVRLAAAAGLNMLRVWGGAAAEADEFYDACDAAGVLVWQDFWITGDCNGRGAPPAPEQAAWPEDHPLWLVCAAALIRRLRSRACLALWCGGNEQRPAADLDAALGAMLGAPVGPTTLDASRLYVPGSLWSGFASGDGAFSDGPYGCAPLERIFDPAFYPHAFNPEVGATGVPVADSVRRALPAPADAAPPALVPLPDGSGDFAEAPNAAWVARCFQAHGAPGAVRNQLARYGPLPAGDLDAYCERAQLVCYEQYRALLEAWGSRMWACSSSGGGGVTGMLLWKLHNPWPGLRSALFDYWHDVGGGYAAALAVTARTLHAQLNARTRRVEVVNTSRRDAHALTLTALALRLDGSVAWHAAIKPLPCVRAGSTLVTDVRVPEALPSADVFFLRLQLLNAWDDDADADFAEGVAPLPLPPPPLARNFYWLHAPGSDFRALQAWRRDGAAAVRLSLAARVRVTAGQAHATLRLHNASTTIAFFIRLSLRRGAAPEPSPAALPTLPPPPPPPSPQPPLAEPRWRALLRTLLTALGLGTRPPPHGDVLVTLHAAPPPPEREPADDRVLPVFWSNNYVSLLPLETLGVDLSFALHDARGCGCCDECDVSAPPLPPLRLEASGWNVPLTSLPLQ